MLTCPQMNYAIVIFAFIFVFAMAYWYIEGKKNYTGPVEEAIIGFEPSPEPGVKEDISPKVEEV